MSAERLAKLEAGTADVLPDSRTRNIRGMRTYQGAIYLPMFCISCHRKGPWVVRADVNHVAYLCEGPNSCAEKYGAIANTCAVPDEVHAEKVREYEMEKFKHPLTVEERAIQLADPHSRLSVLLRDAPKPR